MLTFTKNNSITAAGIDIGSNSIRLLIAEVKDYKIHKIIYQEKAATRLATNIEVTGMLSEEPFNNSINVLSHYKSVIDKYGIDRVKVVATSAVREAKNGNDFIQAASNIGINIDIISGNEEGLMEYLGVCSGLEIQDSPFILDVGGGSTEAIYLNNKDIIAESFKVGVVKLADMFDFRDNALKSIDECKKYIQNSFQKYKYPNNINTFIATAGTSTTLAAIDMEMKEYNWQLINGYTINIDRIKSIMERIASTKFEDRIKINGMDHGREDLIIPGTIIILEFMDQLQINTMTVSDFGLREGAVVRAAYN